MSDGEARILSAARGRVLVVDDDVDVCALLEARLAGRGFEVECTTSAAAALDRLATAEADAVLTDIKMAHMNGLELCEQIVARRPDLPVVVMTAFGTLESAIGAIRVGAYDFVTKPVEIDALVVALERAVQHRALRTEVERLRRVVDDAEGFGELLGASAPMKRVYDILERVVSSDATVLVTGESGTGKELVARALHRRGRRSAGPFVAVNCAAMPEALLESELFGHARGAFTDARSARAGLFQQAHGGTLFLDEIADLPRPLQPRLLRVLQERTVRPLGADHEVRVDVRIIAATNRDLETAVEEGRLREDLYFRLNVIHVELPPLRVRGRDILLLAQRFVDRHAREAEKPVRGLSPAVVERLLAYPWPGNVRELHNCMERALALASGERIQADDLPEAVRSYRRTHVVVAASDPEDLVTLEEVERRYILRVMEAVDGHRTRAAQVLGLDRKTLYRKLESYAQDRRPQD
jgi:two-component system, NtrC family, response regulator AtoC